MRGSRGGRDENTKLTINSSSAAAAPRHNSSPWLISSLGFFRRYSAERRLNRWFLPPRPRVHLNNPGAVVNSIAAAEGGRTGKGFDGAAVGGIKTQRKKTINVFYFPAI